MNVAKIYDMFERKYSYIHMLIKERKRKFSEISIVLAQVYAPTVQRWVTLALTSGQPA